MATAVATAVAEATARPLPAATTARPRAAARATGSPSRASVRARAGRCVSLHLSKFCASSWGSELLATSTRVGSIGVEWTSWLGPCKRERSAADPPARRCSRAWRRRALASSWLAERGVRAASLDGWAMASFRERRVVVSWTVAALRGAVATWGRRRRWSLGDTPGFSSLALASTGGSAVDQALTSSAGRTSFPLVGPQGLWSPEWRRRLCRR